MFMIPLLLVFFQFTTSQGGRLYNHINSNNPDPFNSRPHKEVDATGLNSL